MMPPAMFCWLIRYVQKNVQRRENLSSGTGTCPQGTLHQRVQEGSSFHQILGQTIFLAFALRGKRVPGLALSPGACFGGAWASHDRGPRVSITHGASTAQELEEGKEEGGEVLQLELESTQDARVGKWGWEMLIRAGFACMHFAGSAAGGAPGLAAAEMIYYTLATFAL